MSNEEVKKNTELCEEKRELTKDELLQVTGGVSSNPDPAKMKILCALYKAECRECRSQPMINWVELPVSESGAILQPDLLIFSK